MKHIRKAISVAAAALLVAAALSGCSANSSVDAEPEPEDLSWLPEIPVASAPGVDAAGAREAPVGEGRDAAAPVRQRGVEVGVRHGSTVASQASISRR